MGSGAAHCAGKSQQGMETPSYRMVAEGRISAKRFVGCLQAMNSHPTCPHLQVAYAGRVWTFPPTPDPALGPCGRVCAVREVNGTRWRWWGSVFSVKTAERAVASLQRLERQVTGQGWAMWDGGGL
jgi:hypothetical protein